MKNIKQHPVFLFLFFLLFWGAFEILMARGDFRWSHVILGSFIYASLMTFSFTKILFRDQGPIYIKLQDHDRVLKILEEIGAESFKSKGEKHFYRVGKKSWFSRNIILKKTPFYLYVDSPPKYMPLFLRLQEESGKRPE